MAFVRLLNDVPLKLGQRTSPVGHGVLVFNPTSTTGISLEVRNIDMRRIIDLNVLAVPPPGRHRYYKAPLQLETTPDIEPRRAPAEGRTRTTRTGRATIQRWSSRTCRGRPGREGARGPRPLEGDARGAARLHRRPPPARPGRAGDRALVDPEHRLY